MRLSPHLYVALFGAALLLLPTSGRAEDHAASGGPPGNGPSVALDAGLLLAQEGHIHGGGESGTRAGAQAAAPQQLALGKQVFAANCARCHGENAEGKAGPKLKGTPHSPAEIQQSVTRGFPGKMPAFAATLSKEQTTAVAAYVRSLAPPEPGGWARGTSTGQTTSTVCRVTTTAPCPGCPGWRAWSTPTI